MEQEEVVIGFWIGGGADQENFDGQNGGKRLEMAGRKCYSPANSRSTWNELQPIPSQVHVEKLIESKVDYDTL